jgi:hypothetical protein
MVQGKSRRYPHNVAIARPVLRFGGVRKLLCDYLIYTGAALAARWGRGLGLGGRTALVVGLRRLAPALGLRVAARFAEWRAMGWM